jgi:hypothetical protein
LRSAKRPLRQRTWSPRQCALSHRSYLKLKLLDQPKVQTQSMQSMDALSFDAPPH